MFLATTANQSYWDKNQELLFLGEWCKKYSQRHIWSKIEHKVLPTHWHNAEKIEERFSYLSSVQEKYLEILAARLNEIHDETHSLRYWRIILGPWLSFFTGIIYDRYLSIKQATDSNLVSNTWLPPIKHEIWVPTDFKSFAKWTTEDDFNLYLYGRIITQLKQIPYITQEAPTLPDQSFQEISSEFNSKLKNVLKKFLETVSENTKGSTTNKVVICNIKVKIWDLIKLYYNLGQFPYLRAPQIMARNFTANEAVRSNLKISQSKNEFENLLEDLIIEQIPTVYVEGYKETCDNANKALPKKPKIILTGTLYDDDAFNIWVAHQTNKGTHLTLSQHGAGYGIAKFIAVETHELEICDQYFTWGWTEKNQTKLVPMRSAILRSNTKYTKPDTIGTILIINHSNPRYFYRIEHVAINLQLPINLGEQERFLKKVSPAVFKILLMRLYPVDYGWDEKKRFTDNFPSLNIYQGSKLLVKQLRKSRLAIHFHNVTTFLETISINFPTVLYFDPIFSPIRLSAKPYYDDLIKVKILHTSPESIANWVNQIYDNPGVWWESPKVQEVKDKFCRHFARTGDNWIAEWKEELLKITKE
tara:strand:+ start:135 stop:1898 length:1764 start_codon:yes stop_codon:yes gene_type:complete